MIKNQEKKYESPKIRLFGVFTASVIMGSWGNGIIDDEDKNELYDL